MAKKEAAVAENGGKNDGKSEALKLAIAQITKQFGDGSIMKLGETPRGYRTILPFWMSWIILTIVPRSFVWNWRRPEFPSPITI